MCVLSNGKASVPYLRTNVRYGEFWFVRIARVSGLSFCSKNRNILFYRPWNG